ncbi:hypothetical protein OKA04_10335 [Luteolibacter flavescens]|uniref:Uncharacterized protein n=1 Tax=Luteolibacter flavescens TaxID=1859460 RepID=A0ABT3FPD7_9BACT|nr:hypothetical protein [Luteolibacter flavescens]MCW1885126.1 hypothetical protein [Luteolibacter flavescens]
MASTPITRAGVMLGISFLCATGQVASAEGELALPDVRAESMFDLPGSLDKSKAPALSITGNLTLGDMGYWMGQLHLKKEGATAPGIAVEYTYTASGTLTDFFATYREGNYFYKWMVIGKDGKYLAQRKKWNVKGIDKVDRDGSGMLVKVESLALGLEERKKDATPVEQELYKLLDAIRADHAAKNPPKKDDGKKD